MANVEGLKSSLETKYKVTLDFIVDTQGIDCLVRDGSVVTDHIRVDSKRPENKDSFFKSVSKFLLYDLENYLKTRGGRVNPTHKHKLTPIPEIERLSRTDIKLSFRAYPKSCKNDRLKFKWLNRKLKEKLIERDLYFELLSGLDMNHI